MLVMLLGSTQAISRTTCGNMVHGSPLSLQYSFSLNPLASSLIINSLPQCKTHPQLKDHLIYGLG